jgi:hypothetical protein
MYIRHLILGSHFSASEPIKWDFLHISLQSQVLEHPDLTFNSGSMALRGKIFRAVLFMQLTVMPLHCSVSISIIVFLYCAQYMFYFFLQVITVFLFSWRHGGAPLQKKPAAKMLRLWRPAAD